MLALELERHISRLKSSMHDQALHHDMELVELQQDSVSLESRQADIYQEIARIGLLELPSQNEHQGILRLQERLRSGIKSLKAKIAQLEQQQVDNTLQHKQLTAHLEALVEQRDARLCQDEPFIELYEQFQQFETTVKAVISLRDNIYAECTRKLSEYDADPRYAYLLSRRYGETDYKGKWIFHNLDNWLARQVDFNRNRQSQKMLIAMRDAVELRKSTAMSDYDTLHQQVSERVMAVEQKLNIGMVRQSLEENEQASVALEQEREKANRELDELSRGEGSLFAELTGELARIVEGLPINKVDQLVHQTPSTDDERLFSELLRLKGTLSQSVIKVQQKTGTFQNVKTAFRNIEQLENQLRNQGFFNRNYDYILPTSRITEMLEGIRTGKIALRQFIEELSRHRDIIVTPTQRQGTNITINIGTIFTGGGAFSTGSRSGGFGSSGRSSSTGGGGFSTTSSTGGGGFRTTDSF